LILDEGCNANNVKEAVKEAEKENLAEKGHASIMAFCVKLYSETWINSLSFLMRWFGFYPFVKSVS